MVDHRYSGSEIHGVPRGQVAQWHPLSHPAVCLPAAICGQRLAPGVRICGSAAAAQALQWPPINGEWEKFTRVPPVVFRVQFNFHIVVWPER